LVNGHCPTWSAAPRGTTRDTLHAATDISFAPGDGPLIECLGHYGRGYLLTAHELESEGAASMTVLALDVVDLLTANNRLLERLCDAVCLAGADRTHLLADLESVLRSRHQADESVMYPQWRALDLADPVEVHRARREELIDILADLRTQAPGPAKPCGDGGQPFDAMLRDLADLLTTTIEEEEALLVLPLEVCRSADDRVTLGAAFTRARQIGGAVAMASSTAQPI
jgi:hypothetical protein